MRIFEEVRKRFAALTLSLPVPTSEAAARQFALLIQRCPVCRHALSSSHAYHTIATAVPESDVSVQVAAAIARGDWTAMQCCEWNATQDSLQFTAIMCPNSSCLGLVKTFHPFDYMNNSRVEFAVTLSEGESIPLRDRIGEDWTLF